MTIRLAYFFKKSAILQFWGSFSTRCCYTVTHASSYIYSYSFLNTAPRSSRECVAIYSGLRRALAKCNISRQIMGLPSLQVLRDEESAPIYRCRYRGVSVLPHTYTHTQKHVSHTRTANIVYIPKVGSRWTDVYETRLRNIDRPEGSEKIGGDIFPAKFDQANDEETRSISIVAFLYLVIPDGSKLGGITDTHLSRILTVISPILNKCDQKILMHTIVVKNIVEITKHERKVNPLGNLKRYLFIFKFDFVS